MQLSAGLPPAVDVQLRQAHETLAKGINGCAAAPVHVSAELREGSTDKAVKELQTQFRALVQALQQ